jgi:cell division protein FtsZ
VVGGSKASQGWVVANYETGRATRERNSTPDDGAIDSSWEAQLRLGQDVRFVLAAVGGGAIRVVQEIARRHVRHLETVAINCDPKVQSFEDFDRRVYLGPDSGAEIDTGGSPIVGGVLARAAEPALDRIFEGATFVILVGSLGGGAGSGALPHLLRVASRHAEYVSAFVIRPFRCEGERRALADRAIGQLHFVESFVEKREQGSASLRTLDNESLIGTHGHEAFRHVSTHWADLIQAHVESSFIFPAEALLEAAQLNRAAYAAPMNRIPDSELPALRPIEPPSPEPHPEIEPLLPSAHGSPGPEVELTFEIVAPASPPTLP